MKSRQFNLLVVLAPILFVFTSCSLLSKEDNQVLKVQINSDNSAFDTRFFDKIPGKDHDYFQVYRNDGRLDFLFKKVLNKIKDKKNRLYETWQLLSNVESAIESVKISQSSLKYFVYKFKSPKSAQRIFQLLLEDRSNNYNARLEDEVFLVLNLKEASVKSEFKGTLRENPLIKHLTDYNDKKYVLLDIVSIPEIEISSLLRGPTNRLYPETPLEFLRTRISSGIYPEQIREIMFGFLLESAESLHYKINECFEGFDKLLGSEEVRNEKLLFSNQGVIINTSAIINKDLYFSLELRGLENPNYSLMQTVLDKVKDIYPIFNYNFNEVNRVIGANVVIKDFWQKYSESFYKFQEHYTNIGRFQGIDGLASAIDDYLKTHRTYPSLALFESKLNEIIIWDDYPFKSFLNDTKYRFNYTLLKDGYLVSAFPKDRNLSKRFFALGKSNNNFIREQDKCTNEKKKGLLSPQEILRYVDQNNTHIIDLKKLKSLQEKKDQKPKNSNKQK